MNQMLDKAMKAAAPLSEREQNEVAEGVLEYVALLRGGGRALTDDQRAGVEQAQREAHRGGFASADEMTAIWRKFGI